MKRLLLITVMLTAMIAVRARDVRSFNDLVVGDTFNLKITVPMGEKELHSPWNFNDVQKLEVVFRILSKDKDSVRIAVKPRNWYVCYKDSDYVLDGRRIVINNYLDSDYYTYYDLKSFFFLFEKDAVTATVNLKNGGVNIHFSEQSEDFNGNRSAKKLFIFSPSRIPKGLTIVPRDLETDPVELDVDVLVKLSLERFIQEWKMNVLAEKSVPLLIDLSHESEKGSGKPAYIQLESASFRFPVNTQLKLTVPERFPEDQVFIVMNDKKIKPDQKQGGTYWFNFFLPAPRRAFFNDLILDITPSDSLNVTYTQNNYKITGRGAVNSIYTNAIAPLYRNEFSNVSADKDSALFFQEGETFYRSILTRYASEMNDYWLRSASLSFDYWYASEKIRLYNEPFYQKRNKGILNEAEIPWDNVHFKNLYPFTDYLYQPYMYGNLLQAFFEFKAGQTNNSILTGMKYLKGDIPKYYFADAILVGYPRFYLTSETLKERMIRFHLSESKREYEDFTEKCKVSELREPIINLYNKLLKVEPGANLKDLNLDVGKYIPFKNKSQDYIVLLVKERLDNNPEDIHFEKRIKRFHNNIRDEGLVNNVKLCIITGESQKKEFDLKPEIQEQLIFVPDKAIRDYEDKVASDREDYILMKSDGTIIDRWHNSKYLDSPYYLIKLIQEDIYNQKNKSSTHGGTLSIIVTILISVLITFLIVRYFIIRRERTKRKIQELELKAIRAQMNPHFIFNALGSIQNLIARKKDKEANEYLVNFSRLLRIVLSSSEKKLIPLSEEISLLDLYLRMEQLRIPFDFNIHVDENIDTGLEEMPGMLIQPIVENAVKHGIAPKGKGNIGIDISKQNNILYIVVTDDGSGINFHSMPQKDGFGLKSVNERLLLLNKELHLNISLQIRNVEEDNVIKGCRVTLMIPV